MAGLVGGHRSARPQPLGVPLPDGALIGVPPPPSCWQNGPSGCVLAPAEPLSCVRCACPRTAVPPLCTRLGYAPGPLCRALPRPPPRPRAAPSLFSLQKVTILTRPEAVRVHRRVAAVRRRLVELLPQLSCDDGGTCHTEMARQIDGLTALCTEEGPGGAGAGYPHHVVRIHQVCRAVLENPTFFRGGGLKRAPKDHQPLTASHHPPPTVVCVGEGGGRDVRGRGARLCWAWEGVWQGVIHTAALPHPYALQPFVLPVRF